MRFVFLQAGMTGYQHASLCALAARGHEILNVSPAGYENAAFDFADFTSNVRTLTWTDQPPPDLNSVIAELEPDVVVMASWRQPQYRSVMAGQRGKALRILFSSNIWQATPQQWLGRLVHRAYLRPFYDCVFVPGERSEWFARRLGFSGEQIIRGANSADVELFDRGQRSSDQLLASRRFLFTGRLMAYKGVAVLCEAWRRYRTEVAEPWDLDVVGLGGLASDLAALPGVRMHGFLQPPELAALMHETACLVLPSLIDFYGVVVHEAATAGQVLLCSDGVGATPHLLQDGYNGWTIASGSVDALAGGLARASALSGERLVEMSEGSRQLAKRLSPSIWADHLSDEVRIRRERGDHLRAPGLTRSVIRG
ncbi:MAG: glycosyltransferase family 4 protein [Jatrophihabitans sp.]